MGWRIVKQPNGAYARWTDVVDGFTHLNLSRREALEVCREQMGSLEAEQKVKRADLDEVEGDETFEGVAPGLRRWTEGIATMRTLGKETEAAEAVKLDREFVFQPDPERPLKLGKLAIMYSEPQTLLCTEGGQGIATCHGKDRAERELVAQWLVAQARGLEALRAAVAEALHVIEPAIGVARIRENDPSLKALADRTIPALEKLRNLLTGA